MVSSLLRGLSELNIPYQFNKPLKEKIDVACVLTGPDVLCWAIKEKQKGNIKKIIAGPIISIAPQEENGLILSPEIDIFVVPSPWVRDWWISTDNSLGHKVKLWSSGVEDRGVLRNNSDSALVFKKNAPEKIFSSVLTELTRRNIHAHVIEYGSFSHKQYFDLLAKSKFVVYLTNSESQGLALAEAWMADIPTLVWSRGYFEYKNYYWEDQKISSPFLTQESGLFFRDEKDLGQALDKFLSGIESYSPRKYALANFSDKVSTQKYLNLIKTL